MQLLAFLGLEAFVCLGLTFYMFHLYVPFRRLSFVVNFAVFTGYLFSMLTIVLVPSDLIATQSEVCRETSEPGCINWTDIKSDVFYPIWSFLFFSSALHTWVIVPFIQGYLESGHFTFWDKCKYSLRVTFLFYIACILGLVALVSYLYFTQGISAEGMQGVLAAMTNTSGLLLLFALLGYGLVEFPRSVWFRSNNENSLMQYFWNVANFQDEMDEARSEIVNCLRITKVLQERIDSSHPYRFCVEKIVSIAPPDALKIAKPETKPDILKRYGDPSKVTKSDLAEVMRNMQSALDKYLRSKRQLEDNISNAIRAEEVISLQEKDVKYFGDLTHFSSNGEKPEPATFGYYRALTRAYWEARIRPWALKVVTCFLVILSLIVVWCESTVFADDMENLSLFTIALKNAKSVLSYQIVTLGPLSYITLCAYWSLLQFRLSNFYVLLPGQENDPNSLLMSSTYLFRLAMPTAYNFLFLVNEYQDTSLAKIMGTMEVIPLFGQTFNLYFPMILIFLCVFFFFNLSAKLLKCCHVEKFALVQKEIKNDVVEIGKSIVGRERKKRAQDFTQVNRKEPVRRQDIGVSIFSGPQNTDDDDDIDIEENSSGSAPLMQKPEQPSRSIFGFSQQKQPQSQTPQRSVEMTARSAAMLANISNEDREPEAPKAAPPSLRSALGLGTKASSVGSPSQTRNAPSEKASVDEYQFGDVSAIRHTFYPTSTAASSGASSSSAAGTGAPKTQQAAPKETAAQKPDPSFSITQLPKLETSTKMSPIPEPVQKVSSGGGSILTSGDSSPGSDTGSRPASSLFTRFTGGLSQPERQQKPQQSPPTQTPSTLQEATTAQPSRLSRFLKRDDTAASPASSSTEATKTSAPASGATRAKAAPSTTSARMTNMFADFGASGDDDDF